MMKRKAYTAESTLMVIGVIAAIVLVIGAASFASIGVGEAGIVIDPLSGTVSDRPEIGPKWFFKSPLASVKKIRYTMATLGMWGGSGNSSDPTADFPGIQAFSAEGVDLDIDISVRFSIDPNELKTLYVNYPALNWETTTIASIARETVRFVIKDYGWEQIRDQREEVAYQLQERITKAISDEPSLKGAIINVEVDLRNVGLPQELIASVNAKVAAKELMLKAEYDRLATLIHANATAQSQIIDAKADAQSRQLRAEGESLAIEALIGTVGEDGWKLFYQMQKLREISEHTDTLILTMNGSPGDLSIILPP